MGEEGGGCRAYRERDEHFLLGACHCVLELVQVTVQELSRSRRLDGGNNSHDALAVDRNDLGAVQELLVGTGLCPGHHFAAHQLEEERKQSGKESEKRVKREREIRRTDPSIYQFYLKPDPLIGEEAVVLDLLSIRGRDRRPRDIRAENMKDLLFGHFLWILGEAIETLEERLIRSNGGIDHSRGCLHEKIHRLR